MQVVDECRLGETQFDPSSPSPSPKKLDSTSFNYVSDSVGEVPMRYKEVPTNRSISIEQDNDTHRELRKQNTEVYDNNNVQKNLLTYSDSKYIDVPS